jgi:hypothetical protein
MRCVLVYSGSGQPDTHRDGVTVKGIAFPAGAEVEVSAELAGQILAKSLGFTCKSGVPTAYVKRTPAVRQAIKALRARQGIFGAAPAEALSGLPRLGAEALKATPAQVTAGEHDASLYGLAVWAAIGGKADLASACVARAEALSAAV